MKSKKNLESQFFILANYLQVKPVSQKSKGILIEHRPHDNK